MQFDGIQNGEQVLYVITPHKSKLLLSVVITALCIVAVGAFLVGITSFFPTVTTQLRTGIMLLLAVSAGIAGWWMWQTHAHDKTYVTDRRIIRFDVVSPFFTNKRALFWNEVLKIKAFAPNMVMRLMKVGTIQVEPVAADAESIAIDNVYFYEDLANYLDKIIFTFKNKPTELHMVRPFVTKPKGQRD